MRRFSSSPGMDRENAEREKGKETNTYPAVYKPGTIKAARKTITLSLLAAAGCWAAATLDKIRRNGIRLEGLKSYE